MKTADDLNALIPAIIEKFEKEEHDLDGWNCFEYEKDGLSIWVEYYCKAKYFDDPGDYWTAPCSWVEASGEVSLVSVIEYNEETDEERKFSDEDTRKLRDELNRVLLDI